jgi:hypothetical protein
LVLWKQNTNIGKLGISKILIGHGNSGKWIVFYFRGDFLYFLSILYKAHVTFYYIFIYTYVDTHTYVCVIYLGLIGSQLGVTL